MRNLECRSRALFRGREDNMPSRGGRKAERGVIARSVTRIFLALRAAAVLAVRLETPAIARPGRGVIGRLLISVQVFLRHVVLRNLLGVNFGDIRVGRVLDAADHFSFKKLSFFD